LKTKIIIKNLVWYCEKFIYKNIPFFIKLYNTLKTLVFIRFFNYSKNGSGVKSDASFPG